MVIIMRMSDLQNKDVIDIHKGEKLGIITDLDVSENGTIEKIYLYEKNSVFKLARKEEVSISWNMIKKIGADTILVSRK